MTSDVHGQHPPSIPVSRRSRAVPRVVRRAGHAARIHGPPHRRNGVSGTDTCFIADPYLLYAPTSSPGSQPSILYIRSRPTGPVPRPPCAQASLCGLEGYTTARHPAGHVLRSAALEEIAHRRSGDLLRAGRALRCSSSARLVLVLVLVLAPSSSSCSLLPSSSSSSSSPSSSTPPPPRPSVTPLHFTTSSSGVRRAPSRHSPRRICASGPFYACFDLPERPDASTPSTSERPRRRRASRGHRRCEPHHRPSHPRPTTRSRAGGAIIVVQVRRHGRRRRRFRQPP